MKKIGVLIAVCVLSALALCCSLSLTAYADASMTVVATYEQPEAGQNVTVTVDFADNLSGFNTLGVALTYPEGFSYQSSEASTLVSTRCYLDALRSGSSDHSTYIIKNYSSSHCVKFIMTTLNDITGVSGSLFSVTFRAPTTLPDNPQFTVELVKEGAVAEGGDVVTLLTSNQQQSSYQMGDVNRDGTIDVYDVILIMQARAGAATLDAEQQTLADVTYDNTVDVYDVMRILRYRAGAIDSLEEIVADGLFEMTSLDRPSEASVTYLSQFGCLAGIARYSAS